MLPQTAHCREYESSCATEREDSHEIGLSGQNQARDGCILCTGTLFGCATRGQTGLRAAFHLAIAAGAGAMMDMPFMESACPLAAAFGAEGKQIHDLRPSLRAWAGLWTVAAGSASQSAEDLAILMIHRGGAPITAWLSEDIDHPQELERGGCLLVRSGMPFHLKLDGEASILGLIFDEALIRMSPIPVMARAPGHYELIPGTVPPPNMLAEIGDILAAELTRNGPPLTACRAALILTMIEFIAADKTLARRHDAVSTATQDRIERVLRLIDENISLDLPLEWLAGEAGLSPYHLSRNFRRSMGVGIGEYTKKRRLQAACRLLAATRRPLAEIAYDCGFSSQSRMTSVFRQLMNTTPLAYRKACWKVEENVSPAEQ